MKTRRTTPWAMRCMWTRMKCVQMCEKIRGVRVFCSHTQSVTVDHNHLQTKPTATKKRFEKNCELTSNCFWCEPPRETSRWKPILPSCMLINSSKLLVLIVCVFVDLDGWALQWVLLIRGVSDFSSWQLLCNQVEASQAHFCLLCSEKDTIRSLYLLFSSGMSLYVWSSFANSSRSFHFCSDLELWFTVNWNTGIDRDYEKMFTLGVDFLTASLPRIPSQVVFSLYLGLAVSSTMGRAFTYHEVQDRDCIQS